MEEDLNTLELNQIQIHLANNKICAGTTPVFQKPLACLSRVEL